MNDATQPKRRRMISRALCLATITTISSVMLVLPTDPATAQISDLPSVIIAATIFAEPATQVPFPIRIAPTASIPRNSFVRVRGVPPMAALSDGHSIAPGSWAIPLQALANLTITFPAGAAGKADILVSLVAADGSVLVEAKCTLVVSLRAPPQLAPVERGAQPPAILPEDRERALNLLQKGHEHLAQGLVAPARLLYERAADLGFGPAAMALAGTYDAAALKDPHLRGISPDAKEAKRWYERARQLGATDADQRLRRLGGN